MTTERIFLDERSADRDEVLANAARAASGLDAMGVREGDAVALLLRNDFAFIEATQACALLGAYCVRSTGTASLMTSATFWTTSGPVYLLPMPT